MATRSFPGRPSAPASGGVAGRYTYLVARLRNRQITMEEATELFGIMDETIRTLRAANLRAPPPPPPRPTAISERPPPSPAASGVTAGMSTDDLLAAGVLMIGAGAGIAAALRHRAGEGARTAGQAKPSGSEGPSTEGS